MFVDILKLFYNPLQIKYFNGHFSAIYQTYSGELFLLTDKLKVGRIGAFQMANPFIDPNFITLAAIQFREIVVGQSSLKNSELIFESFEIFLTDEFCLKA